MSAPADVTVSDTSGYAPVVPLQPRRYVSTSTPEAEAEIPPVVVAECAAYEAWQNALDARDEVVRRHYAAGVEVRDLVPLVLNHKGEPMARQQVQRIVQGAREGE